MNRILCIAAVLLSFIFSGCATLEKQAFNRQVNTAITKIVILEPAPSTGFGVVVANHPALAFGLIGASIYTVEMSAKSNSLDRVMKPLNWSLSADLAQELASELTAVGYQVSRAKVKRDGFDLLSSYKAIVPLDGVLDGADAYLDVATRDPLYIANSPTADYLPSLALSARLISVKDQTLLYREDFNYGFAAQGRHQPIIISAGATHRYPSHDDLLKSPETTLSGVKDGVAILAKRIAADLAQNKVSPVTLLPAAPNVAIPTAAAASTNQAIIEPDKVVAPK